MTEIITHCLQCGKPLRSGRSDKKFCNEGCRNLYHNMEKMGENEEIKKINQALKDNRRILKKILGNKTAETITHEQLLKEGFELDYHTHFVITIHQKNEYTFCYNYGYRRLEDVKYKVIKSFK
jgi:hypothetical protein